jgi:hypothetical protein
MNRTKFIAELNKDHLWYKDEVIDLMKQHDLHMYVSHITDNGMHRWYPEEVVAFLDLVDESRSNNYPWANASEKHIPSFLLK